MNALGTNGLMAVKTHIDMEQKEIFLEIKVEKSILKVIYKNFSKQEIQEEEI